MVYFLDYRFVVWGYVMIIDGRKVLLKSSVGSVNYNLTNKDSDKDYKYFVMPTFDDIYNGKYFSKGVVGEEVDYTVHDIRKLTHLLEKGNINFIEVLFANDMEYDKSIEWLINNRDMYSTLNVPYLYDACIGTHFQKMKLLFKGTSGTQKFVDMFGYDTKQAMCAYRMLDFIRRFVDFHFDFKKAITYEDGTKEKAILMGLKEGRYTLTQFLDLKDEALEVARGYKDIYKKCDKRDKAVAGLEQNIKGLVLGALRK